ASSRPRPRRWTSCPTPTSRTRSRRSPRSSGSPCTSRTWRASPTRRSPTSWAPRSVRSCRACTAGAATFAAAWRRTRTIAASPGPCPPSPTMTSTPRPPRPARRYEEVGRRKPEETSCREVLSEVYLYLDLECDEQRRGLIQTHLDECSPCLREYGI